MVAGKVAFIITFFGGNACHEHQHGEITNQKEQNQAW
jgi:hypothetical protein